MVLPHGVGDLYHKYRPRRFEEIAGHASIVKSIRKAVTAEYPSQAYLLTGESGTGKTTTARIMALSLNCEQREKSGEPCLTCASCKTIVSGNALDITEVNAADNRGIGDIRSLCGIMGLMPFQLKTKVFILDECHQLTNDAQSSLLKELEEAPKNVYIILCSTHPQKILPTVKNRCQKFTFGALKRNEMLTLIEDVSTLEGRLLSPRIYEAIADSSGGSPRKALVSLQQVLQLGTDDIQEALALLGGDEDEEPEIFRICFTIEKKGEWGKIVDLYNSNISRGAATIGMFVAGYFRNKLLKSGAGASTALYAKILELFIVPFPEGKLGENQLVLALYKAWQTAGGVNGVPTRYGRDSNRA